jgi:hypothetical protein
MINSQKFNLQGKEKNIERLKSELARYKKITISKEYESRMLRQELKKIKLEFLQSKKEKRYGNRVIVSLCGEFITGGRSVLVLIDNISKKGMHMRTSPAKPPIVIAQGEACEIKFKLPSGKMQCLNCNINWSYKTPPLGLVNCIGCEIINPPPTYNHFLNSLQ